MEGCLMKKIIYVVMLFAVLDCSAKARLSQKILIISVPKSGTHLLGKVISLITGQQHRSPGLHFSLAIAVKALSRLNLEGKFSHVHSAYSPGGMDILQKKKVTTFFIYRDPRDQIISWMHYDKNGLIVTSEDHFIRDAFNPDLKYVWDKGGVARLYNTRMPWAENKDICAMRFEDLIGSKGNGSDEMQRETIQRIANHLGVSLTEAEITSITQQLFGGTATFHEGKIGSWKDYFTPEHKDLCKKHAGRLLIQLKYENSLDW